MPSKQTPRASVKQTPSVCRRNVTTATKIVATPTASSTFELDEVASLFNAIKQTKARKCGSATGVQSPSSQKRMGGASKKLRNSKDAPVGAGASSSSLSRQAQSKPQRDGLYHAPERSVQMSDNQFFSGTWLKEDRTAATATSSVLADTVSLQKPEELLRKEGVDRIVSMEELSKMLSRSSRAGTSPNCPFDCDCCF
ncbi:hypothetical protein GH5_01015 [Leishmania sp. Ghana 2012 LV757]|uniref:hypothetical protein n=1 Tax=Leishmania sp. Ghana 2012 LV757 TaxID=2803181 RepID=UPI001B6E6E00|nr:hypothetical protein GH5_01015 [Leishmania sp. Ghana 2012 LV757]